MTFNYCLQAKTRICNGTVFQRKVVLTKNEYLLELMVDCGGTIVKDGDFW